MSIEITWEGEEYESSYDIKWTPGPVDMKKWELAIPCTGICMDKDVQRVFDLVLIPKAWSGAVQSLLKKLQHVQDYTPSRAD